MLSNSSHSATTAMAAGITSFSLALSFYPPSSAIADHQHHLVSDL
jgi:hypothetical protein